MTQTQDQIAPADMSANRQSPLWMRVLLVASLALNLLVVGTVAGVWMKRPDDRRAMARDAASALYLGALDPADRRALLSDIRSAAPPLRDRRQEMRAEVAATLAALRAEPFDADALAERIATQRGRGAERAKMGDRLLVERLARMTPAERRAYADRLEEIVRRGPLR